MKRSRFCAESYLDRVCTLAVLKALLCALAAFDTARSRGFRRELRTRLTRDTIFVIEDSSRRHRFIEEKSAVFIPGTPYGEVVSARQ